MEKEKKPGALFAFLTSKASPENRFSKQDYEFMNSLSAATLQTQSRKLHWVLIIFLVTIFTFITWASYAQIDEITRGSGKVVPSGQNQILQNLEGGIVSEILVKEGDQVLKGQTLIRISNEKSSATVAQSELKQLSLEAKIARLKSESTGTPFTYDLNEEVKTRQFFDNEKKVYELNKQQLSSQIEIFNEQINQKTSQLKDARQSREHLSLSLDLIKSEVEMTKPMVERGIRSQVDFLKLQREENDAVQKFKSAEITINKTQSEIKEIKNKIKETKESYRAKAGQEYNDSIAELKELQASSTAFEDQVSRTTVRSPSNGIVKKMHVNTIGGAVKPAQDLIEIVPTDYSLIVEVKVLPSDIAFIYQGQKAIVKLSAYDFAIYGGLDGKVINISPDTIIDTEGKTEQTYYLVWIQTDKNFLGNEEKPMNVIPGMVANADIITGKKSVLDYILKPILKTKQYTFTER